MDKKELIRKSAIKVIARDGFHDARVKCIADEAGIAAGTVYLYFKNKEAILDYIFSVEHKKRADFVNELYVKNYPIDKVLDSFLEFHFNCFKNEPDTAKVLNMEVITASCLKEQKAKYQIEEVLKAFGNILARERANNKLRKDMNIDFLSTSIIYFLRVSSHNLLMQGGETDYDNMKKLLKTFILYGITG
jgi:TetR/AcrR family fatty acid metabolism transcriptional regulator